jgi:hypothetical protein
MFDDKREDKAIERLAHAIENFNFTFIRFVRVLQQFVDSSQGAVYLEFIQIGDNMSVQQSLIGLTPGSVSKFQIVPRDAAQNPISLDAGSTLTYTSSDPVNAPATADPADPSGLTMLVTSSKALASAVTLQATASLQKNGKTPTTGPVSVSVLTVVSSGAVDMIFNQLS